MKRIFTLLVLNVLAISVFGQLDRLIDFEEGYADTAWTVFGNASEGSDADIDVVLNPFADDVNSSDSVLMYLVRDSAVRWCGMYTDEDVLTHFTDTAYTLAMMVYKDIVSPTSLKVELSLNDGEDQTIPATNSVTEEWELLIYEFPNAIGYYYERLTVFPDFPATDDEKIWEDHYVYIDNIGVPSEENTSVKEVENVSMWLYPTPAEYRMAVNYPGMTGIILSDIMGRKIRSMKFATTDSKVIETGDLKTGIYFVTAETPQGKVTMRFLKK
jgi:hypothetical protein